MREFHSLAEAQTLALAIVDTLPEPFLVLDEQFHVLAASRCFYEVFMEDPEQSHGRSLFEIGDGHWDIPGLRKLMEAVIPEQVSVEGFEFEQEFHKLGKRTVQLSAHPIHDKSAGPMVLLSIRDCTKQRKIEQEKALLLERSGELVEQQKMLVKEMRHRIANSLQIIASILLLKASSVTSKETRNELRDAHQRVMSVAAVQSHLHEVPGIDLVDVGVYLTKLGAGLASSMISPGQSIKLTVAADKGTLPTSQAVSLGLIVTELVINAIKHAFPKDRKSARIRVIFEKAGHDWKLTVSDNGTGRGGEKARSAKSGLGTVLIAALAKQLDAQIEDVPSAQGLTVSVTRASFVSRLPQAA
ncbi:MAG: histidine kinase dimerization/phosphoacceptor domain -containing protein [Sphingomicrobium sp.]